MATSADASDNHQDARHTSHYHGVDLTAPDCVRRGNDHQMGAGALYGSSRCCWSGYESTAFSAGIHISPELILLIFLPALLFEASWNLNLKSLRENLAPILWLSVFGVTVSVGIIGHVSIRRHSFLPAIVADDDACDHNRDYRRHAECLRENERTVSRDAIKASG